MRFSKKGSRHFVQRGFCPYVADHQAQRSQLSHYLMLPQTPQCANETIFKEKILSAIEGSNDQKCQFFVIEHDFCMFDVTLKIKFWPKNTIFHDLKKRSKKAAFNKIGQDSIFSIFFEFDWNLTPWTTSTHKISLYTAIFLCSARYKHVS